MTDDEWWHAFPPERKAQIRTWLDRRGADPEAPHPLQRSIEEIIGSIA